jgi:hypothetical protein
MAMRKTSLIVVDGTAYRWRMRKRATNSQVYHFSAYPCVR